jgi:hypothetical protein
MSSLPPYLFMACTGTTLLLSLPFAKYNKYYFQNYTCATPLDQEGVKALRCKIWGIHNSHTEWLNSRSDISLTEKALALNK